MTPCAWPNRRTTSAIGQQRGIQNAWLSAVYSAENAPQNELLTFHVPSFI